MFFIFASVVDSSERDYVNLPSEAVNEVQRRVVKDGVPVFVCEKKVSTIVYLTNQVIHLPDENFPFPRCFLVFTQGYLKFSVFEYLEFLRSRLKIGKL